MLEPDTNKTNKVDNRSLGRTGGTKDQTSACQPLTRDFQPRAAWVLAVSYIRPFEAGAFPLCVIFSTDREEKTSEWQLLNVKMTDASNHLPS